MQRRPPAELEHLLDLAVKMRQAERRAFHSLRGATVACAFARPSVRTLIAWQAAAYRLGLLPVVLRSADLAIGGDEPIEDLARSLDSCCDLIVAHLSDHASIERLASASRVPVINAGSDAHAPCPALAAMLTLRDHYGTLSGIRIAHLGKLDGVGYSVIEGCASAGMQVIIASANGQGDAPDRIERARVVAIARGGSLERVTDFREAAAGAHAVYVGGSGVRANAAADLDLLKITQEVMLLTRPGAMFLHGLPARRGRDVEPAVLDGHQSAVWQQSENLQWVAESSILTLLVRARDLRTRSGTSAGSG